jgi:hypothetical protein
MELYEAQTKLDDAKKRYLDAKNEIDTIRQHIANLLCPLKIGDKVQFSKNVETLTGIVEHIGYCSEPQELLEPALIGVKDGWCASGKRIRKTTNVIGKWSFSINSFDYCLINNVWVGREKNLDDILN